MRNSIPDFDVVGATSLFTTAHELAAWDRNFITKQVGGEAAFERLRSRFVLTSGDTIGYAHGLSLGTYRGLRTEGHGGSDAGYRSQFLRFPDEGLSVAVLCNFPAANPGGRARRVASVYLEDRMEDASGGPGNTADAETVPMTRRELRALAGVYRGEAPNQIVGVRLDGDTLKLVFDSPIPLRPIGEDRFDVVGQGVVVTLTPPRGDQPGTMSAPGLGSYTRADPWEPSEEQLHDFAGVYHSAELGTDYRFAVEGGRLTFSHRKLESRTLTPTFRDAFLLRGASAVFTRAADGGVAGFSLSDGRVWNVIFQRVRR